jgi:hypothetical protein
MEGNTDDRNARYAATQFVIPPIPLAKKNINKGMEKNPTAKSSTDWRRITK